MEVPKPIEKFKEEKTPTINLENKIYNKDIINFTFIKDIKIEFKKKCFYGKLKNNKYSSILRFNR